MLIPDEKCFDTQCDASDCATLFFTLKKELNLVMQDIYFPFVLMTSFIQAVLENYNDVIRLLFDMVVYTTDEKYKEDSTFSTFECNLV